jgi:hypothetical protein
MSRDRARQKTSATGPPSLSHNTHFANFVHTFNGSAW